MKTIFVVDDSDVNLLMAENALSERYDVFTLSSAALMFKLLNNVMPNLILLDIMMPDTDGFEALERLKADSRYREIPVMFLTSRQDTAAKTQGIELGAKGFIAKPFTDTSLLDCVNESING
ncbi:MAG: response regulator [Oscillospiraceae bacterium]|nr:response regulator [Oscillospiraceae bacterium]